MTGASRSWRRAAILISSEAISRRRCLRRALRRLPGGAAQAVELRAALGRAVARQQLDVLDGQIELVAAGIADLQAVVRGAERGDGGEPVEAADAVVGVHDEIADGEAGRFRDDVGSAARLAPRAHEPVAQDVLLADDGEVGRLEALLEAEHREGRLAGRQRQRLGVALDLVRVGEAVLGEQRRQPLARARREGGDDHALALRLAGCARGRSLASNTLTPSARRARPRSCARCGRRTSAPRRASIARLLEGRQVAHGALRPAAPAHSSSARNMRVGRHRLVGRRAEGLRLEALRRAPHSGRAISSSRSATASSARWSKLTGASGT